MEYDDNTTLAALLNNSHQTKNRKKNHKRKKKDQIKSKPNLHSSTFKNGDVVWAKAFPYTWWPGLITSIKNSSATISFYSCEKKTKWFRVSEIRGFEEAYPQISKLVVVKLEDAINLALEELNRRTIVGLNCCILSREQEDIKEINEVREKFDPAETVGFVRDLAKNPWVRDGEVASAVRVFAEVYAYRRYVSVFSRLNDGFGVNELYEFVCDRAVCCWNDEELGFGYDSKVMDRIKEYREFVSVCPRWMYRREIEEIEDDLLSDNSADCYEVSDSSPASDLDHDKLEHSEGDFSFNSPEINNSDIFHENIQEGGVVCTINRQDFCLFDINQDFSEKTEIQNPLAGKPIGEKDVEMTCPDEGILVNLPCSNASGTYLAEVTEKSLHDVRHVANEGNLANLPCLHTETQNPLANKSTDEEVDVSCANKVNLVNLPCSTADNLRANIADAEMESPYHSVPIKEEKAVVEMACENKGGLVKLPCLDAQTQNPFASKPIKEELDDSCANKGNLVNSPCSSADSPPANVADIGTESSYGSISIKEEKVGVGMTCENKGSSVNLPYSESSDVKNLHKELASNKDVGSTESPGSSNSTLTISQKDPSKNVNKKRRHGDPIKDFFETHKSLICYKEAMSYARGFMKYARSSGYDSSSSDQSTPNISRCREKRNLDQPISPNHSRYNRLYASPLMKDNYKKTSETNETRKTNKTSLVDRSKSYPKFKSLHIKFPKDSKIPSREELEKLFGMFGKLDSSKTRVFNYTGAAQVFFVHHLDARTAYKYVKKKNVFGNPNIRIWFDEYERFRTGSRVDDRKVSVRKEGISSPSALLTTENVGTVSVVENKKYEGSHNSCDRLKLGRGGSYSNIKSCLKSADKAVETSEKKAKKVRFLIETG